MSELYTNFLECDGECGSKIEVTVRSKKQRGARNGDLAGVAEMLGWKTVDKGGKNKGAFFFCEWCQDRAKLIVEVRDGER